MIYVIIAVLSLIVQIILAEKYGGIGCAFAVSGALILGQGLIMNIYYAKVQHLDIITFWKEILRMSIVPVLLTALAIAVMSLIEIDSWIKWIGSVCIYCLVYVPLFWRFSMNQYEHEIVAEPVRRLIGKFIYRAK
jgi:hypothetical protein